MAKISELRHRITFQSMSKTPDGQGGFENAWVNVTTVWAKITPVSSREPYKHDQLRPEVTHRITIRWMDGLDASMQILFDGRVFQIKGPPRRENEQKFFMILDCEENVGA